LPILFLQYALYSYWRSGASWRVRIVMAHKNIPFEYRPINLLKGEQKSGDYAKLNPQHKVRQRHTDASNVSLMLELVLVMTL